MTAENDEREAQVWLAFASAAIAGYIPPEDEELEGDQELVEDMVEISTLVADSMLQEFNARYGPNAKPRRKGHGRKRRSSED